MARLFCLVVLVTIVAATLAAPMREMLEKEAILRELLEDEKFWDWFGDDEETTDTITTSQPTTEAPQPTTEAPQPLPIISLGQASRLTSNRICGAAQTLFPRSEKVESKRDLVINMIYDICLPSVGLEDLEAFEKILDFLRTGEEEDIERLVPTTPEPELTPVSSAWNTLIDNLAEAQNNGETLEDEEDVQDIVPPPAAGDDIADTGADADAGAPADANGDTGANAGADANADAGADTNSDAGADANTDAGADTNADAGADANADAGSDANANAGADANVDAGADTTADVGADTNTDAGADANADADADAVADTGTEAETGADGADTNPAPAKRLEDAEILSMLLKAIELNQGRL